MLLLSLNNDWQPLLFESGKCENSFVDYKINYEKLCYLLRKIWTDPLLKRCLYNMLMKFEQNRMVQNYTKFWAFWPKKKKKKTVFKSFLTKRVRHFERRFCRILSFLTKKKKKNGFLSLFLTKRWRHFERRFCSWKKMFNAKLLIWRLQSFSVPKITVLRYV